MGGVITEEPFLKVFPETRNANTQGIVIAVLELGAFFGSILCMMYGDQFGRRAIVVRIPRECTSASRPDHSQLSP
jgi:MFS family permease